MSGWLGGLGALAGGVSQGLDQGQLIRQRAMQIQQAQMALDEEKKKTAAAAYAGGFLGGGAMPGGPQQPPQPQGMPPQGPQPPPPGQSSQAPQQPMPPQGGMQQPQGQPPAGGAPMPPQGQPQQPQVPQGPSPGGSNGFDPTDPQAPVKALMAIAQQIKAKNPNIDPQTLAMATQQVVEMSKGLDPAMRSSMQLMLQQLRGTQADARLGETIADRDKLAGQNDQLKRDLATQKNKLSWQETTSRIQAANDRLQQTIAATTQRFNAGQMNQTQKTAADRALKGAQSELMAAQRTLALYRDPLNGGFKLDKDGNMNPAAAAAMKAVDTANSKVEFLADKLGGVQAATVGGATNGPTPNKPPPPKVGTVESGHRFKGGYPADPKNWEPVNK